MFTALHQVFIVRDENFVIFPWVLELELLCSNDRASLISKWRRNQLDVTNSDLLVINSISTCFGHLYTHHQEIRLRSTAYSCLSYCSCCDAGESGIQMCALCGECCLTQSGNILHTESGFWLCLETVIKKKNLHETYQCWMYSRELLMMVREDARNM